MAGESARKKKNDEVNAVFWLATRAGKPWTYLLSDEEFLPINIAKTANIQLNRIAFYLQFLIMFLFVLGDT